jgi:hypothetical protein
MLQVEESSSYKIDYSWLLIKKWGSPG